MFDGHEVLKVAPQALTRLAREALRDASFLMRTAHLEQVAAILDDPDASDNDRGVALAMLRNAEVSARFVLPFCQDRASVSGRAAGTPKP
jgi:fumarate hydratase class I